MKCVGKMGNYAAVWVTKLRYSLTVCMLVQAAGTYLVQVRKWSPTSDRWVNPFGQKHANRKLVFQFRGPCEDDSLYDKKATNSHWTTTAAAEVETYCHTNTIILSQSFPNQHDLSRRSVAEEKTRQGTNSLNGLPHYKGCVTALQQL